MFILPNAVFIHMPKIGGTFVVDVLQKLPRQPSLATLRDKIHTRLAGKHPYCRAIPAYARQRQIFSCIRSPIDWYISNYHYAWWRTNPQDYPGLANHPDWPNLSFDDYMALSNTDWLNVRNPEITVNPTLGRLTTLFINYFSRDPIAVLTAQGDDASLLAHLQNTLYPVTFLHTENLNQELYDFLRTLGYQETALTFIHDKPPLSPRGNRDRSKTWSDYFSEPLFMEMLHRDRLLYQLFPTLEADTRQRFGLSASA